MRVSTTLLLMVVLSSSGFGQSFSPSVISSGGDVSESSRIHLSWTIGELAVENYGTGFGLLTEGFHQANLCVQEITSSKDLDTNEEAYSISVYPNPVSNSLLVVSDNLKKKIMHAVLYDAQGKTCLRKTIQQDESECAIDVSSLAQGIYFLHLIDSGMKQKHVFSISKK